MRTIIISWVLYALLAVPTFAQSALPSNEYRDLTYDGAWCWFADPRAVRFAGVHDRTNAG